MISGKNSYSNKNLVKAIRMDFTVKKGDTFSYTYDVTYIDDNGEEKIYDLTNCFAQMQIKKKRTDKNYYTVMAVNINITTGQITFYKSNEDMQLEPGTYWYDLEIKNAEGVNITWIEGKFKVLPDVTQWIKEVKEFFEYRIGLLYNFVRGMKEVFFVSLKLSSEVYRQKKFKNVINITTKYLITSIPFLLNNIIFNIKLQHKIELQQKFKHLFGISLKYVIETYIRHDMLCTIGFKYSITNL